MKKLVHRDNDIWPKLTDCVGDGAWCPIWITRPFILDRLWCNTQEMAEDRTKQ